MNTFDAQPVSGTLGIVHRAAGEWRILIVEGSSGRLNVIDSETIPSNRGSQVAETLSAAKVGHVVQVVPATASVCRTCILPDSDERTLAQALRLQAETTSLAGAPPFRLGGGILPKADGETTRTGLLVAWPESARVEDAGLDLRQSWMPEPAAVAALLGSQRPTEPMLTIDRSTGGVCLAVCHPGGAAIRATTIDGAGDAWNAELERTVAETALTSDHTPAFAKSLAVATVTAAAALDRGDAAAVVPASVRRAAEQRINGLGTHDDWWQTYGVAVGAALGATRDFVAAARMEHSRRLEQPSLVERFAVAAARPRTAATVAVLALIAIAFLPVVVHASRVAILEARHGSVREQLETVEQARTQLAMYRALESRSWPITKTVADIVCHTPDGITLGDLVVSSGSEDFRIRGEALTTNNQTAKDLVVAMQTQLGGTGLFDNFSVNWEKENNFGTYEFVLSGRIVQPHDRVEYELATDYGRHTAWERMQGLDPLPDARYVAAVTGNEIPEEDELDEEALAAISIEPRLTSDLEMATGSGTPATAEGSTRVASTSETSGRTIPTNNTRTPSRDVSNDRTTRPAATSGGTPPTTAIPTADRTGGSSDDRPRRDRIMSGPGGEATGNDPSETETRIGGDFDFTDIPEPLTSEQISTMDRAAVLNAMTSIGDARKRVRSALRASGDEAQQAEAEALNERLREEWDMLVQRNRDLRSSGGSS